MAQNGARITFTEHPVTHYLPSNLGNNIQGLIIPEAKDQCCRLKLSETMSKL